MTKNPITSLGRTLLLACCALPLGAADWDLRLEVPFPKGQNLPQTLLSGSGQLVSGDLDTGHGVILTLGHELLPVNPVLRIEFGGEAVWLKADGDLRQGATTQSSRLTQRGLGVHLNAQFWIPFTGVGGEMGLIQRFQNYKYEGAGASQEHTLSRTWLRVGARWRLPFVGPKPYLCASYQQPLSKDRPVKVSSTSDLSSYLNAQGAGQEFRRMWTFGVGVVF